jgi:hypothetical protein
MSTQYRLVQSGNTASGGCSAGQGSSEPVAPRIYLFIILKINLKHSVEITHSEETPFLQSLHMFLRSFAHGFIPVFASTCLCEETFSKMKHVKTMCCYTCLICTSGQFL